MALLLASPAAAQHMDMPGMAMPTPTPGPQAGGAAGTAASAGDGPPPAPPADHYADRAYDPAAMAQARATMMAEHGGGTFHQVLFNLAEYQARAQGDGYRWDGEAWFGGDIDRLVVKSEGEGAVSDGLDSGEVQAVYSRAIDPYWNVQGGARHDIAPGRARSYATLGIEGLAPYWFEVEAALFLSDRGDLLARAEGYYDQRLTQRLVLQPRVELNFAAQDVPATRIGAGLSNAELGMRLRYELRREIAPYVGVSFDRKLGDTARYAQADGDRRQATSLVLGVRTWF